MLPLTEKGSLGTMSQWDAAEMFKKRAMPRAGRQCPKAGCRKTQPCPKHPQGNWTNNTTRPLPSDWKKIKAAIPKTGCAWRNADGTICGSWTRLELDHIIERADGGTDSLVNFQWLCHHHHDKKTRQARRDRG